MTPEEIVEKISEQTTTLLYGQPNYNNLTHAQVLDLLNTAAMQGVKFGSNVALSMVKGALVTNLMKMKKGEGK